MNETMKAKWQKLRMKLVMSIGQQLKMEKNDIILMIYYLSTPKKIKEFSDWTITKTVNGKIDSTPEAVMSAATRIGRGMDPLD